MIAGRLGLAERMDETSFGAMLFDFQPPRLYGGGELDGFHDLLILAYRVLRGVSESWVVAWVGLVLVASVGITGSRIRSCFLST
ncbi:hypothetical protein AB395_00005505 (plasmid) [Sinorhizobium fredii CCBAU 45436]|nr:hypothetical protein AB395_00005505 [Sinorhizobium fredii CCBAU 45436]